MQISGVVHEPGTERVVRGATVTLYDWGTLTPARAVTSTDEAGVWVMELPGEGPYRVEWEIPEEADAAT